MKRLLLLSFFTAFFAASALAEAGDTLWVQTFTFADGRTARQAAFDFPDGSVTYSKVLMYYTLKCDNYPYFCGTWDYDVYTDILKPVGTNPDESPVYDIWRIGVYITPYGGGISLGNGWTWTYDVSDFLPLLKGSVILRDNNTEELLDLKFAFIEGAPARNLIDIKKVWDSRTYKADGYWAGYPLKDFDNIVKDTAFALNENEKQVKLKTTLTGHMMDGRNAAAEFSSNIHTVMANGQIIKQWQILQPCDENPLYPQGGTWIYNRAGWCTGAKGVTYEFELTPYITDNSINFDYDVQADPDGVYRISSYLITYGNINQSVDAAAEDIIAPTNNPLQARYNPTCGKPVVVIKNIGANPLTQAEIAYGFVGGTDYAFVWNGNLPFMQTDTVALPLPDWNEVTAESGKFWFEIRQPNGVPDPTPYNNRLSSAFKRALLITNTNSLQFNFTTNKGAFGYLHTNPNETTWKLCDMEGNILLKNPAQMTINTLYQNDFSVLSNGSYQLYIYDAGGDGLNFFEDRPIVPETDRELYGQGTGSAVLRYRKTAFTTTNYQFEANFGRFTQLYFAINRFGAGGAAGVENVAVENEITVFPNPAQSHIFVDLTQIYDRNPTLEIVSVDGKTLISQPAQRMQINKINTETLPDGLYMLLIKTENGTIVAKGKVLKK